jgi:adenosylhomocysteinase
MEPKVYTVPGDIDTKIAEHKLKAMGVKIDTLSDEQKSYITGWEEGT